jgi:hypothetical protein
MADVLQWIGFVFGGSVIAFGVMGFSRGFSLPPNTRAWFADSCALRLFIGRGIIGRRTRCGPYDEPLKVVALLSFDEPDRKPVR